MNKKSKWVKPKLIVLVNNIKGEGVLDNCKTSGGSEAYSTFAGGCGVSGCTPCSLPDQS